MVFDIGMNNRESGQVDNSGFQCRHPFSSGYRNEIEIPDIKGHPPINHIKVGS
jgi:hypothetical protein